ncbi:hypothetical protein SUGI_0289590 [Cryptomeria japonica]|nr:hypothetical protein SUGI_0289590 [Cryptomeria japonica]
MLKAAWMWKQESKVGLKIRPSFIRTATLAGLQKLQCNKPKSRRLKGRRKSSRSGCNKSNRGKCGGNVCRGRQVCNCAASYAADCAAICCCPCALLHLFILAFVVAPCALARKAFCYVKKKAKPQLSVTNDNGDDDERGKDEYFTPPWSCTQSPVGESFSPKVDTEMVWWELYAAGHMGFGGLPFERD